MKSKRLSEMTKKELEELRYIAWHYIENSDDPFNWKWWFYLDATNRLLKNMVELESRNPTTLPSRNPKVLSPMQSMLPSKSRDKLGETE